VRKIIALTVVTVFALGLVFTGANKAFAASAKDKPVVAAAPKAEEKKAEAPKIVCKFKDKDQMAEFEKLYVAKQATFGRMGVLQAYFTMEQSNLQEIDKQMEKTFNFKMDQSKMYDLDRENMEIKEVGAVPQKPAQQ
jgi:hypothetical protein